MHGVRRRRASTRRRVVELAGLVWSLRIIRNSRIGARLRRDPNRHQNTTLATSDAWQTTGRHAHGAQCSVQRVIRTEEGSDVHRCVSCVGSCHYHCHTPRATPCKRGAPRVVYRLLPRSTPDRPPGCQAPLLSPDCTRLSTGAGPMLAELGVVVSAPECL